VVDVTSTANRWRRTARLRLGVELAGVAVAAPGVFPFTWPLGLVFVAVGAVVAGLPRVILVRTDQLTGSTGPPRWWLPGRRRLRVAVYSVVSGGCVLAGIAGVVLFGVGAVMTSPLFRVNVAIAVVSVALVAAGTLLYRRTLRVAAATAWELRQVDPRPMVLYLRAFADDALTLRSARYARPLLLERLSPRGFDRFEETIARTLTAVGPVVAVNPPDTGLAPLGAARDTLDPEDWQPQVAHRIRAAGLIVIGAAPATPAPGLAWELSAVDGHQRWPTTVLVLPPLPSEQLRRRWTRFAALIDDTTMAGHHLPPDPTSVLVVTGSPATGWTAMTATRRDEWTYAAGLAVATERITGFVGTPVPPDT
jgi:hypothetical protein